MALITQTDIKTAVSSNENKKWLFPFILVTSLFFFWGFVHNLDPILIPHLRKAFNLTDLESSLIDSSVFIAYFVMALPAGYIMRKYGYKSGIMIGLVLFGIGSILFVPAANSLQYIYFLGALFVIACGLTFLINEPGWVGRPTICGPSCPTICLTLIRPCAAKYICSCSKRITTFIACNTTRWCRPA